jgi:hypothetical protein
LESSCRNRAGFPAGVSVGRARVADISYLRDVVQIDAVKEVSDDVGKGATLKLDLPPLDKIR